MPAVGRFSGTPASISASEAPQTEAIDDEPFELGDLRHDADGVGEVFLRRQHRTYCTPRQLAVTDLAAARRAHAPGFADRIGREVVVQHERFFVGPAQRVDPLLVLAGAERGDDDRLRLAAGEQRRAVGARQEARLDDDRAHGDEIAAVDALAGVENVPAHDLAFELLEHAADGLHRTLGIVLAVREEVLHRLLLDGGDSILTLGLARNGIGLAEIGLDNAEHLLFDALGVGGREFARLLGGLFGELDDGLNDRLEVPVAEHHGAQHDLFGQLLGLQFDHQHGVLRAGDDQIELAFLHLVDGRVEHVFVVYEGDARAADRSHERSAGQRQCCGCRNHRHDVGIVLLIVRHHGAGHLGVAAPAVCEQRTDRAVDQAGGQRVLFGRTALALEVAAGDAAGRVILFGVVDGQRHEIDAGLRRLGGDHGSENGGLAVGGDDGAVGLTGDLAGFQS